MAHITNWEEQGVSWQLSGVVTSQEIFDFTNEFYENPKSDAVSYQIVDCLNVERFELGSETMLEIAALDYAASLSICRIKVALVGKDPLVKKINQEYLEYSAGFNSNWIIKNFENMNDARIWVST
ncbi:MAG: hypothetical protein KAI22_06085 [Gammaproteobacteria bacterium]|nr:hypothetical protein [Gammaproteobacteria bacterium]